MSEAAKEEIGTCPNCGTTIWSDHPYDWCSKCGDPLPGEIRARMHRPEPAEPAAAPEGEPLVVLGKTIACPICGHDGFRTRKTLMSTGAATVFGVDWANPSPENYICTRCGHVLWFLRK